VTLVVDTSAVVALVDDGEVGRWAEIPMHLLVRADTTVGIMSLWR
jgi:hypothetical protein